MPLCSEQASFLKESKKESIVLEIWVLVCLSLFSTVLYTKTKVIECFFFAWSSREIICILKRGILAKIGIDPISLCFLCRTLSSTLAISKAKQVRGGMEV